MNPDLAKAQQINAALRAYRKANPSATQEEARAALGLPPKGQKGGAMAKWTPPGVPAAKGGAQIVYVQVPAKQPRKRRSSSAESIVPTEGGGDVTTRGGARLHANIKGHVVVSFEGPGIGAMLGGFFRQLMYGDSSPIPTLFPDLYPEQAAAAKQLSQYAQERAIGAEEAKMLGAALRAYGVTPEMWAAWYVDALAKAPPLPTPVPSYGAQPVPGPSPAAGGAFGPPLALPSAVTDPFGAAR